MNDPPTFLDALARRPTPEGCGHAPERVRLWDGVEHCVGCVEAACPGLAALAKERDCLKDSIVDDRAGALRVWWRIAWLFFGALALAGVGIAATLDWTLTLIIVGTIGFSLGVGLLASFASISRAKSLLPTVRVSGGLVEVFRPSHGKGQIPVTTFRLADAHWRMGKLQEDSSFRGRGGVLVADQRVVILRSPRRWAAVTPPSEFTAIGSSPEMVRVWQGFLKLAGVPEGK